MATETMGTGWLGVLGDSRGVCLLECQWGSVTFSGLDKQLS